MLLPERQIDWSVNDSTRDGDRTLKARAGCPQELILSGPATDSIAAVAAQAPRWLAELIACPIDGEALQEGEGGFHCRRCERFYPVSDGVAKLSAAAAADAHAAWVADEKEWWDSTAASYEQLPLRPDAGIRGRSRERNLFRHVRELVGPRPTLIEMGAGSSRTVAGLWPPGPDGPRYVATDVSNAWLRSGAALRGGPDAAFAVQCDAGRWPFRPATADVVLALGVLHHLPDWRAALTQACESVHPGGYLLLHEVIHKPRIFASRRSRGVTDNWTSPHEGSVREAELRAHLDERGTVVRWRRESTPLRFAVAYYGDLSPLLERSPRLTAALEVADQAFGHTAGRIRRSLGFNEVTCVWRRGG